MIWHYSCNTILQKSVIGLLALAASRVSDNGLARVCERSNLSQQTVQKARNNLSNITLRPSRLCSEVTT